MNLTFFSLLTRRNFVLCSVALAGITHGARAADPVPPPASAPLPAVKVAPAVAPAPPAKPETKTPAKPADWRILVLGDSQAQGLAAGFMRLYLRQPNVHVLDRSKIGTGLSRDKYDWPGEVKKIAAADHADVAVVIFGANDRPNVRPHGKVDPKLADKFTTMYGGRVTSVATTLRDAKLPVIWVGHPQVRDPIYNQDMQMLNAIFEANATKAGAVFVPTWTVFAGADGGYDAYGKGLDGETTRLRADDGVHLTRSGYDVLAKYLQAHVEPK